MEKPIEKKFEADKITGEYNMERIIEAINKSKQSDYMQEYVRNFEYRFDEVNNGKINMEFDIISESNVKVNVSVEKLDESYAYCKVHTDLQQYEGRVSYGILSKYINGIVRETLEILE